MTVEHYRYEPSFSGIMRTGNGFSFNPNEWEEMKAVVWPGCAQNVPNLAASRVAILFEDPPPMRFMILPGLTDESGGVMLNHGQRWPISPMHEKVYSLWTFHTEEYLSGDDYHLMKVERYSDPMGMASNIDISNMTADAFIFPWIELLENRVQSPRAWRERAWTSDQVVISLPDIGL